MKEEEDFSLVETIRQGITRRIFSRRLEEQVMGIVNVAIPLLSLLVFLLVIYDVGFNPFRNVERVVITAFKVLLIALAAFMGIRFFVGLFSVKKMKTRIFTLLLWLIVFFLLAKVMDLQSYGMLVDSNRFLLSKLLVYALSTFIFLIEISSLFQYFYRQGMNPPLMFISSFALLILIAALLLNLPNATFERMKPVDALFTATAAVSLTGMFTVDISNFTTFGLIIIILMVQIGGLGIMTFAGLLAYAVAGGASFRSQIAFREMLNRDKIGNIIHFVYQVIIVTLFFEAIGAVLIYFSLDDALFDRKLDKIFFSVFHSISGFCNAGITTLSTGLYNPVTRFNYSLHLILAVLVVLGGMGFPIVFNLYAYIKIKLKNLYSRIFRLPMRDHLPRVININSRLALVVTGILTAVGLIFYILFEQNASLRQHPTFFGKLVTSIFGAVTPRTAGFNTVDVNSMAFPTIMIYMLLMWIGASPGSMGGGIKTTTIGVAVLNVVSVIQGKDRTEFSGAEITEKSIRRAFAIIFVSVAILGITVFLISVNDGEHGLFRIAFEAFGAFSTAGLSMGITPQLSSFSKMVLIVAMFVGRVGMLTMFIAFVRQSQQLHYRYPKEEITF